MDLDNKTSSEIWAFLISNPDIKLRIIENMKTYGGSFVQALSECLLRADQYNLKKIIDAFKNYIIEYQPKNWSGKEVKTK